MIQRCYNSKTDCYYRYGGRGIQICEQWRKNYWDFHAWAIRSFQFGLTLDRKDNGKSYSPGNCRWATIIQQQNNTRLNKRYLFQNVLHTVPEISRKLGLGYSTIEARVRRAGCIPRTELPKSVVVKHKKMRRLPKSDVHSIIAAIMSGRRYTDIASDFGVTDGAIRKIAKRHNIVRIPR